ncbi:MAG: dipeptide epimerase [Paraglaciecola sp.]|nr:dipeptide epimerase [Paraglaciecola sp.]NCT48750.1 dipeptide epimerase [Paraglaciecola sp.]
MRITNIRFAKLKVPLITPFKTAIRTVQNITDLVVIIDTDTGHVGYGSAPSTPLITGDTHQSIHAAIGTIIGPQIIGMAISEINEICQKIKRAMVGNPSAKAALEIAVYDLWGKFHNAPLHVMLGGGSQHLRTDLTISVDHIDKMLNDAHLALKNGFEVLKIKIGINIKEDIERVSAVYQSVGHAATLRLDVNQGWTAKQTVFALHQLEAQGVELELIEQPVKSHDIDGMRYICQRVNTPVMADESAFSSMQVLELIRTGAADIINIKLMKCGGISEALNIVNIAQQHNISCMMGCMLEGSISVAAAAHIASARASGIPLLDLDGPALGQFDPVQGGVDFHHANITLGTGAGLGIETITGLEELSWPF